MGPVLAKAYRWRPAAAGCTQRRAAAAHPSAQDNGAPTRGLRAAAQQLRSWIACRFSRRRGMGGCGAAPGMPLTRRCCAGHALSARRRCAACCTWSCGCPPPSGRPPQRRWRRGRPQRQTRPRARRRAAARLSRVTPPSSCPRRRGPPGRRRPLQVGWVKGGCARSEAGGEAGDVRASPSVCITL